MPTTKMVALTLNQMTEGDEGIVIANDCQSRQTSRLAELGLAEGEAVRLVRQGSPLLLEIGDARMCLRADEAAEISILCAR